MPEQQMTARQKACASGFDAWLKFEYDLAYAKAHVWKTIWKALQEKQGAGLRTKKQSDDFSAGIKYAVRQWLYWTDRASGLSDAIHNRGPNSRARAENTYAKECWGTAGTGEGIYTGKPPSFAAAKYSRQSDSFKQPTWLDYKSPALPKHR